MKHDLQHEKRQNEALVHIAKAVEEIARRVGMHHAEKLADHVEKVLAADDSEPMAE